MSSLNQLKDFEPRKDHYSNDTMSNFLALKNNVEAYTNANKPLPPALARRLPELKAMQASLSRQGLLK